MERKRRFYTQHFTKHTRALIKSLTNIQEDEENFGKCLEFALDSFIYHQFLDVNTFKVKKKISGFCDKFSIQAQDERSRKLNELATRYYDLMIKEDQHGKDTWYGALDLLIHLSCSSESWENISQEEEKEQDNSGHTSWAEYLHDPEEEPSTLSDCSSSTWSESGEDCSESNLYLSCAPPASIDSGIEISPDGVASPLYAPPCAPFEPFKEPEEVKKPPSTRLQYWDPKFQNTKLDATTSNVHMNFTKIWEQHLAEESPIYTPETNIVLNEAIVVRETLWMLHGLKDLFVYPYVNGHYTIVKHAHMKHMTENTLKGILKTLCHYGEKLCVIVEFINHASPTNSDMIGHCRTSQAYARGLLYFINQYRTVLTSYEKLVIDKKLVTVIQLVQKLKPHFDELELLFNVHGRVVENLPKNNRCWEHSTFLLDVLWKQLVEYSVWTKNRTTLQILLLLFLTSLRPFLKTLEGAVMRGQFLDGNAEFLMQRNEEVGILNELFWQRALSFRELPIELEGNYFLKPLFPAILLASKSMEMLHNLDHRYNFHPSDSFPDFLFTQFVEEFRTQYLSHNFRKTCYNEPGPSIESEPVSDDLVYYYKQFREITEQCVDVKQHWRLCQKIIDVIQPNSAILLHSVIERTLMQTIKNACDFTNQELVRFLKEKFDLVYHLSVMQKYFLMISGDIMFSFYSEVFERMLDQNFRVDLTFINSMLREAVSFSDSKSSERLTLDIGDTHRHSGKSQPLSQLGLLNMSYNVGWPICVILSKSNQERYCQIFEFLLQIKCAKYYLDQLYFHPLEEEDCESPTHLRKWFANEVPKTQKIHGMHIMRMRLLHFINGFHNYIMRRSLHSSGLELYEQLEKVASLEDILNDHQEYLSNLLTHCLFDPKLPYLREQILKLLSLAVQFQSLWRAGVSKVSVDDLKIIESEFSSCINLLKSYLSKPLVRGKSLHLEDLGNVIITEACLEPVFL